MSDPSQNPKRLLDGGASEGAERDAASLLERAGTFPEADQLSHERVWRDVVKQLPGTERERPRRWVLATATGFAVLALAVVAVRVLSPVAPGARVELTAGAVLSAAPTGSWSPAEAGAALPERSRIKTAARGQALIKLEHAEVLVAAASDVAFESLGPQTFIRLSGGEVLSQVEPRRAGEPYVVQTTKYRVTVKGTVFAVRERAPDDVSVSVSRGLVEVSGEGGTWLVAAGRSWNSRSPQAVGNDDIRANEHSLLESAQRPGPRSAMRVEGTSDIDVSEGGVALGPLPITWSAPAGRYHFVAGSLEGDATTTEAGTGARVMLEPAAKVVTEVAPAAPPPEIAAVEPEAEPVHEEPPVPTPKPKATHPHVHRPALNPASETKSRHEALSPPAPENVTEERVQGASGAAQTPDIPAQGEQSRQTESSPQAAVNAGSSTPASPPLRVSDGLKVPADEAPPAPAAEDAYTKAIALSHAGRYAEAVTAFTAVAAAHGPHSDLALYELGRIEQVKLNHTDRALAAYVRYQREYPRGSVLQEVEVSTIEVQLQRHELDAALEQMTRFLDKHGTSERAPEVHLLRGDVRREKNDCRHALDDYAKAAAPAQADDALYFTAWCQQHLGLRDDAAASFGDYLRRFPQGRHVDQARAALPSP